MTQRSNERDVKIALASLKMVLQNIQQQNANQQEQQKLNNVQGQLQKMMRKMRVAKLGQVFVDKMERGNIYNQPVYLHIMSESQINQNRVFKCKGVALDPHLISLVYILDIIFCLVTFVTGSFRAFIQTFKTSGDSSSGIFIALMIIAIVITSLKVVVNSITITIEDGILLQYLTDILWHYIKSQSIFIDLGYIGVNIALLAVNNESQILSIVLFFISIIKLFTLFGNLRTFQTNFINSFKKQQYFNLVKVALFNIFFAHFVCSMLLAMSLIDSQNNWKVVKGIDQQAWYIQYIWAFYWACTIIMTVGFGDISAYYFRQAIILAFIQLFSCIVLAFNISEIGSIIMSIRSSQTQFRRKIAIFKRMAKQNHINQQLQRRIQAYLKQETTIKQTFQFNQQNQLLGGIPINLRNQYVVEANKTVFPDLPFFKNLQKNTLIKFTQRFSGKVYYPGEFLVKLEEGNNSIMILKSGKVGLAYKKYGSILNGTVVQQVKVLQRQVNTPEGTFQKKHVPILLNTDFLCPTKKMNYDIVARSYSFVYNITYNDFYQVIKTSQIDSSYFFSIRDKHSLINSQWEQLECQHCSKPDEQISTDHLDLASHNENFKQSKLITAVDKKKYHTKFECPKLHYFSLNGIVVLKFLKNQGFQQQRDDIYHRRKPRQGMPLTYRKIFFSHYENSRNFGSRSYRKEKTLKNEKQIHNQQNISKLKQMITDTQKLQQIQTIERIVREAIEQGLTGYKPQFWHLQIDKLYNYMNYFPADNPKNLDFLEIGKGKNKQSSQSQKSLGSNQQINILDILKNLSQQSNNLKN